VPRSHVHELSHLPRRLRPPEHRLRRSPPPSAACSRRAAATGHPDPNSRRLQVRTSLVMLPRPSTLAPGDNRRRIWPVKPARPL
jgi:hypothetical protein